VRNARLIARRELRGRVRRAGYRITTIGGLLLIAALFALPTITKAIENGSRTTVAVVGAGAGDVGDLQRALPERTPEGKPTLELRPAADAAGAERLRRAGTVDATLELGGAPRYSAEQPGDDEVARLRAALGSRLAAQRLQDQGLDAREVAGVFAPPRLAVRDTDGKSASQESRTLVYALLLMLYMSILVYGAAVSSAIVQEKASRVTEVMIARVTPLEHMAGKLAGVGLAGLLQFALWIAAALAILAVGRLLGSGGIELADVPPGTFVAFGVFFVLGFTLYGALYAGLSAPASRIEDATAAGAVPGVLIVASFLAATVAIGDPESSVARVLSFIPPLSPMTMFTRVALGSPPLWEVALSVALLLATIMLVLVLSARVYRASILLYGTRPGLRGMLKLVRG